MVQICTADTIAQMGNIDGHRLTVPRQYHRYTCDGCRKTLVEMFLVFEGQKHVSCEHKGAWRFDYEASERRRFSAEG